jgi:soluble lytic murein transglycosylase
MKKSRLVFSRYSPAKRKQQRRQLALASGAGLCALLIGTTLLGMKDSRPLGEWTSWLSFQGQNSIAQGNKTDTPVLQLVSLPREQQTAQLEAIALGSKSLNRARARYLLATDLIQHKQGEKALRWLDGLEGDYSVLAGYIALKKAQAYEISGNKTKALDAWQDLLRHHSNEPVAAEALYALSSNDPKYWEKVSAKYPSSPRLLAEVRQLFAFSPDDPQYWEKAIAKYPSHPRILEIAQQRLKQNPNQPQLMLLLVKYAHDKPEIIPVLDQLVSRYGSQSVGKKDRAIIQPEDWEAIAAGYWENRHYSQASDAYAKAPRTPLNAYRVARGLQLAEKPGAANLAYKQMVRDFPTAKETATALLKIAEIEPATEAVPYLNQVIKQFPDRAGEALLAEAKILDSLKSDQAAAEARQVLLTKYGNSDAAAEYRWNMAQAKAADGDLQAALQWAEPIMTQNPNSEPARKAGFWVGKWASKLGHQQEAIAAFEQVVAKYPQSYYAWRSAVRLGWKVGDFTTVRQLVPKVVLPAERTLLPVGSAALKELYQLGQGQDAWTLWQAEFQNRMQPTVAEQFTDGLIRMAVGEHLEGISQISSLEDRETPAEQAQYQALRQQLAYWQALYPFPFRRVIETQSQQRRLNPLLVTALIRQESRFEPTIRSGAGAVGLMQMLPSTGASVAKQIKLKQYTLSNPDDNVKLGTWFLDQTHQAYNNNSLLALASYNAGSGNLAKWLQGKKATDPDEFVEAIPFDETKDYVKQVFGNYWNYLRLYEPQVQEQLAKYSVPQSTAMRE